LALRVTKGEGGTARREFNGGGDLKRSRGWGLGNEGNQGTRGMTYKKKKEGNIKNGSSGRVG